ncbi:RTA1 like protein [Mollisia scopiformis]|uniref:RTA1 like protein n=1 Tax=Mollisia scopiformis TaxID=149040 RepID=A0A194WTX3_MOLSC|nr:RTA1 like protein [Mollisia scopiformis]KUJ11413.1 RTA1 like protein [Mollisia scopiformis]
MVVPVGYIPGFVCTLATCSVSKWGFIHYQPSLPGNILFLIILSALAVGQLVLGIKFKSRIVCVMMLLGLACEILGYISRILMHYDPFDRAYFLWYLICLTIGPAFLAAAIYVCLGRIVVVYGEHISRIRPRTYTILFMGCDFVSLVIQAIGGGIATSVPLTNQKTINLGTHILVAGLSFQVASLFAFSVCSTEFLWRVHKHHGDRNLEHADLYNSRKFRLFLISLGITTVCLFVRTVFRSVELSGGFGGHLANSEVQFMVLDGMMVIIACFCLTVMHPGIGFGDKWGASRFSFGRKREMVVEQGGEMDESPASAEKAGVNVAAHQT